MYQLTPFERKEIHRYKEVLFVGTQEAKDKRNMSVILTRAVNGGFDNQDGYYKVVVGDHLAYRYEVIQILDKGAFG